MNTIYTLGHSTRSMSQFVALLKAHGVEEVVDIRSIPKSRHCPQFSMPRFKNALAREKIRYIHLKKLGGLRHASKDSPNTSWINASFRGFADYMQTSDFQAGLKKLESIAKKRPCALVCSEGVPWRCHRSLVADALTIRKWKVYHIQSRKTAKRHTLTAFLRIKGKKLIYDK
jgi:uncharacterized protein (DUF488 family)